MRRADSLEMTLRLGQIEGRRRSRQQGTRWLDSTIDSMNMNLSKLWETVEERQLWGGKESGTSKRLNSNNPQRSRVMRSREKSPPFLQHRVAEVSGTWSTPAPDAALLIWAIRSSEILEYLLGCWPGPINAGGEWHFIEEMFLAPTRGKTLPMLFGRTTATKAGRPSFCP